MYVDETAILFDKISVSAGTRGTQLILSPDDYLRAAQALDVPVETADLTKDARPGRTRRRARRMSRALWTHLVKDLRIEWRSKDAINSMLFFALLVVVLFSLAFDPRGAFAQHDCRRRAVAWRRCSPRSAR